MITDSTMVSDLSVGELRAVIADAVKRSSKTASSEYVSASEANRRTGLGVDNIKALLKDGKLKGRTTPGRGGLEYRVSVASLNQFMERGS